MTVDIYADYVSIFEGPVYERSEWAANLLGPALPTDDEVHAEFRAHLHRLVDGVEVVTRSVAERHLTQTDPDGETRAYQRERLFGRATFDTLDIPKLPNDDAAATWRARNTDAVRGPVLLLARRLAERVKDQVVDLRAERAVHRSGFAVPRLEPIVVTLHPRTPGLLRRCTEDALIGFEHNTCEMFAVYAAYYFITPVGVPPKETPCHRP